MLSAEDKKRVESAIGEAEKKTSGEIVTYFVPASDDYRWVRFAWAVIGWLVASFCLEILSFRGAIFISFSEVIELQLVAMVFFSLLGRLAPVVRFTVPSKNKANRVQKSSMACFLSSGLHDTRDRTGVLIFISELERRVQILADSGIHQVVGENYWTQQVNEIVLGIRNGKTADALCAAIQEIGDKLAKSFPPRPDDTNEISNEVQIGETP